MRFFAAWWAPMKCFTTAGKLSEKHRVCLLFSGIVTPSVPKKKAYKSMFNANIANSATSSLSLNFSGKCGWSVSDSLRETDGFSSSIPGRRSREVLYQLEVGLVGEDGSPLSESQWKWTWSSHFGISNQRHFFFWCRDVGCWGDAACCSIVRGLMHTHYTIAYKGGLAKKGCSFPRGNLDPSKRWLVSQS